MFSLPCFAIYQEAADILNVSRPYLVRLLEDKKIPFLEIAGSGKYILATSWYRPELIAVPQTTVEDIRSLIVPRYEDADRNTVPPLDRPFPTFPEKATTPLKVVDSISDQEREQIIDLAKAGVPRREMCGRLGRGKGYYSTVKAVLDSFERS